MAVLCVPQETVPALVDKLYSLGIKNYWNFSHYDINPKYSDAIVEAVHLGDSLMTLAIEFLKIWYNNCHRTKIEDS